MALLVCWALRALYLSGMLETMSVLISTMCSPYFISLFYFINSGVGSRVNKLRVVPIKVEPKVYFANERTFLDWMHMSVLLATISTAIIAFAEANEYSQVYGLVLMPTSIGFSLYALYVYMKRANMIRNKHPGPYEEKTGPIVLATILAITIVANFAIRLYDLLYL